MNRFGKHIFKELVFKDLIVSTKEEAIESLIKEIYQKHKKFAGKVSLDTAFKSIMEREKMQSTGLGNKMAFPHARIDGWKEFVIVLGYYKTDIDFDSMDQKPVNFVCLMISPEDQPYMILKSMSNIIRFLESIGDIHKLFQNTTKDEICDIFQTGKIETSRAIEAIDIMHPLKVVAKLDDSIEAIVKTMHLNNIDVLPVVDDNDNLKGQFSCFNIFEYEIPEFFKQLHTISFVRKIDPFEKFFKLQKSLKVKDLLKEECATVNHDDTLIEIIFQLTVKGHPKLFVTKNKKLIGTIDRFTILDRILFF